MNNSLIEEYNVDIEEYSLVIGTFTWFICIVYCIFRMKCNNNTIKLIKNKNNIKRYLIESPNETELCPICIEELKKNVVKLDCEHMFHIDCLNMWMTYNNNNDCPYCREDII